MDPVPSIADAGSGRARTSPVPRQPAGTAAPTATVSVIVPTFNEAGNIDILLDRILRAIPEGDDYEIIVVDDDSADQTWRLVERRACNDDRIRVIRRLDQRGLSSAVLSGMGVATGSVFVVIDADLQHDERKIPDLVAGVLAGADICLGSRSAEGGSYGDFGRRRLVASKIGAALARTLLGVPVSDPMSGFFAVSRHRYRELSGRLNPRGFKILLEFVARGPAPTVAEVGYVFGSRLNGTTKLSGPVVGAYLLELAELTVASRLRRRRKDPVRVPQGERGGPGVSPGDR